MPPVGELRIRAPEGRDAGPLAHVQVESWRSSFRGLVPDRYLDQAVVEKDRVHDWERLLDGLDRTQASVLVAERDGAVVGFAHLGPSDDTDVDAHTVGELYALHVLPGARGEGIGSALLEAAGDRLRGRGFREGVLWVLAANEPARILYESQGWAADGATKLFADAPELRYRVELAGSR
jgi:ribosomal protein S18 acetylase RimI-like enzyme